jgi:hypothetical protein
MQFALTPRDPIVVLAKLDIVAMDFLALVLHLPSFHDFTHNPLAFFFFYYKDINECASGFVNNCSANATCTNTIGIASKEVRPFF